jgi:hypothetical protein
MPVKKRSLKDVAAAPLVHKVEGRSALEAERPATATAAGGRPRSQSARRADTSPTQPPARPGGTPPKAASGRSPYRSLWRIAASIAVGFIGGIFFGRFIKI